MLLQTEEMKVFVKHNAPQDDIMSLSVYVMNTCVWGIDAVDLRHMARPDDRWTLTSLS